MYFLPPNLRITLHFNQSLMLWYTPSHLQLFLHPLHFWLLISHLRSHRTRTPSPTKKNQKNSHLTQNNVLLNKVPSYLKRTRSPWQILLSRSPKTTISYHRKEHPSVRVKKQNSIFFLFFQKNTPTSEECYRHTNLRKCHNRSF